MHLTIKFRFPLTLLMLFSFLFFEVSMFRSLAYAVEPSPGDTSVNAQMSLDFKPGNALEISVFPDTTSFLNNIYPIDGGGYVFLPLVGKTKITDKSPQELISFLQESYSQYLRFPYIQIRSLIRISVLGGVQKPGFYYVDPNYSLWNVIQLSGGPIFEDGLKKMRWERNKSVLKENLIPDLESGQSLHQLGFRSGDQLWVPSPNKPTFWNKVATILPVFTFGISVYTLYIATQSGRIRTFY